MICFSQLKTNEFPVPKWLAGRLPFPSTIYLQQTAPHQIPAISSKMPGQISMARRTSQGFPPNLPMAGRCHSCHKGGVFGQAEPLNPLKLNGSSPQSCKSSSTPCASSLMVPGFGYLRLQKHLKNWTPNKSTSEVYQHVYIYIHIIYVIYTWFWRLTNSLTLTPFTSKDPWICSPTEAPDVACPYVRSTPSSSHALTTVFTRDSRRPL